jgi:hypothetical protein
MKLSNQVTYVGTAVSRVSKADTLITHPANNTIRRCKVGQALEERQNLKDSILKEGLNEAIKVFANSNYIVGGNTRFETLVGLGCEDIPVQELPRPQELIQLFGENNEIDPMHPVVMAKLRADNTRVTVPVVDRYLQAQEGIECEEKVYGEITVGRKKEIMRESNIAVNTFEMLAKLQFGYYDKKLKAQVDPRKDLFTELRLYKQGKDVASQFKAQYQDFAEKHDPTRRTYEQSDEMDDLLDEFPWDTLQDAVLTEVAHMRKRDWFNKCNEKNFKGAMVHHVLAHYFAEFWNTLDTDIHAITVDNQSRYDIHFMKGDEIINSLEIKTTIATTWSTVCKKYGYALLYKFSSEMDRAAIITSWLDKTWTNSNGKELWKAAGKGAALDAKDLYEYGSYDVRLGSMYVENDTVKVATGEIDG